MRALNHVERYHLTPARVSELKELTTWRGRVTMDLLRWLRIFLLTADWRLRAFADFSHDRYIQKLPRDYRAKLKCKKSGISKEQRGEKPFIHSIYVIQREP